MRAGNDLGEPIRSPGRQPWAGLALHRMARLPGLTPWATICRLFEASSPTAYALLDQGQDVGRLSLSLDPTYKFSPTLLVFLCVLCDSVVDT